MSHPLCSLPSSLFALCLIAASAHADEPTQEPTVRWSDARAGGNGCPGDSARVSTHGNTLTWTASNFDAELSQVGSFSRFCRVTASILVPAGFHPSQLTQEIKYTARKSRAGSSLALAFTARVLGVDVSPIERRYDPGMVLMAENEVVTETQDLVALSPVATWCAPGNREGLVQSNVSATGQVQAAGGSVAFGVAGPTSVSLHVKLARCP